MLKNFLKQNNIQFDEVNLSENKKAKEELFQKTGQMVVPITKIDEELVVGYNLKKIKELLKL
jgi:glutaredoxin